MALADPSQSSVHEGIVKGFIREDAEAAGFVVMPPPPPACATTCPICGAHMTKGKHLKGCKNECHGLQTEQPSA